jgi:hypothetical protein
MRFRISLPADQLGQMSVALPGVWNEDVRLVLPPSTVENRIKVTHTLGESHRVRESENAEVIFDHLFHLLTQRTCFTKRGQAK